MSFPSAGTSRASLLILGWALGLTACGVDGGRQTFESADYAFVDVTVIPMDREAALPDHTVLVEGDRIVAVLPSKEVLVPAEATVIEGRGRYLMPGLADMHTHPGHDSDLLLYPIHGVTMIRINADFGPNLEWRHAVEEGTSVYPSMFVAGPIIDIDPPIFPGSAAVSTPEEARAEVERQVEAGYDFIKIFDRFDRETYRTLIDTAHEHGRPVAGHSLTHVALGDVLAMEIDAIEHMDGYAYALQDPPMGADDDWPERPGSGDVQMGYWLTASEERFEPLAHELVDSGVWTVPTLLVQTTYFRTEPQVEAFLSSDLATITHPEDLAFWRRVKADDETAADAARAHEVRSRFLETLHEAGAKIVAGTDSANPFVVHGAALHDELSMFVDAGMTPYEALETCTTEAARFLSEADEFGRIAPGLRADLLLLDANPLDDVAHTRKIGGVMLRGRWLAREELDAMRAEIEKNLATITGSEPNGPDRP